MHSQNKQMGAATGAKNRWSRLERQRSEKNGHEYKKEVDNAVPRTTDAARPTFFRAMPEQNPHAKPYVRCVGTPESSAPWTCHSKKKNESGCCCC